MADAPDRQHVTVHATCVALGRAAVLIRGASGSGKSDLALRFLHLARGGLAAAETPRLVADDQVHLERRGTCIVARAPSSLLGMIEVRGVGIIRVEHAPEADLVALVDLVQPLEVERMPEPARQSLLGIELPLFRLSPFEASAPIKLAAVLAMAKKR